MAADKNPLEAFLHSDYVVYPNHGARTDVFVPERDFWRTYKLFCGDNNIPYRRPQSNARQVLRQYNVDYMFSRTGKRLCYKKYPRELKPPNRSRDGDRHKRGVHYLVGIDTAARYAYEGRNFSYDVFCMHSRRFNPHVDYQRGNANSDDEDFSDDEDSAPEGEWDYDVFMQRYDDYVSTGAFIANAGPTLVFPFGADATRRFYREATRHLDEIVNGTEKQETEEVRSLLDRLRNHLGGES